MNKPINKLSDTVIKKAKSKDKDYVLSDGGGLQILIKTNGSKYWEFRYTNLQTKKRAKTSFGVYPTITLKEARIKRDEFTNAVMQGYNLNDYKKSIKTKKIFIDVFENEFNQKICEAEAISQSQKKLLLDYIDLFNEVQNKQKELNREFELKINELHNKYKLISEVLHEI